MKKLYIIEKRIMAKDIHEAMRLEKKAVVDNINVDADWQRAQFIKENPMGYDRRTSNSKTKR